MSKLINKFLDIDIKYMRNHLRTLVLEGRAGEILEGNYKFPLSKAGHNQLMSTPEFLEAYYKLILLSEQAALSCYSTTRYGSTSAIAKGEGIDEMDDENISTVRYLVNKDLKVAILPVAVAAWLTIGDFRWHSIDANIPKELSYGLVLQYPDFVIPYAMYGSGLVRHELHNTLKPECIEYCEHYARQSATEYFRTHR